MSRWSDDDATVRRARKLWDDGLSYAAIASEIGVTKGQIAGVVHRRDWPKRDPLGGPRKLEAPYKGATLPKLDREPIALPLPIFVVIDAPKPPNLCCYVVTADRPHRYCEAPSKSGSPYCPEHHKRCYTRVAPPPPTSIDRPVMLYGRLVR